MGNPKQFTPPSSPPALSASGNDENLSESRRNSNQRSQKQQQYMAPKISTASKIITTPKKNNKKMILAEWKPPTPTKSAPTKTPLLSEDETFVPDSTNIPYDPLTNYLSPRPKFLRYNPNRKRKITLRKPERGDSDCSSNSSSLTDIPTRVSLDCQCSCTVNEIEGNLEEEEDGVGWKRVLLNWLVAIFGLVLSTVYISTMNSNMMNIDMNSNSPVTFTEKFEVQDFGEFSFEMVSLRGEWVFDVGDESVTGVSGKFDAKSEVSEKFDAKSEVSEKSDAISEVSENFLQYHSENLRAAQKERDYSDVLDEKNVEIEVPIAAQSKAVLDPNLVTQEENLVDYKVEVPDLVTVVEAPESESKGVESDNDVICLVLDAPIAEVRVPDLANVVELVAEVIEPEIKGVESESEVKNAAENAETDGTTDVNISDVDNKEVRLPKLTYIWLMGLTVMCYVVCMVACLSRKCRRVFTRRGPTRRRLNPQAVREEQTRLVGLPPRVGLDSIHQMSDYIVNFSTLSEVVVPREDREVSEMSTPRRITTTRPFGEVDFGGGFSGAVGRSKMVVREESVFTVPDERSAKRSKVDGNQGRTGPRRSERQRLRSLGIAPS